MKVFFVFDTHVDSYEVSSRAGAWKNIDGVKSVEALERVEGQMARYAFSLDVEDDKVQEIESRIKTSMDQYASYISNASWGAYKKIG